MVRPNSRNKAYLRQTNGPKIVEQACLLEHLQATMWCQTGCMKPARAPASQPANSSGADLRPVRARSPTPLPHHAMVRRA